MARKPTSASERRLSGVERKSIRGAGRSAYSHNRTLALQHIDELPTYGYSSSKALASIRSGVAKPSVNQSLMGWVGRAVRASLSGILILFFNTRSTAVSALLVCPMSIGDCRRHDQGLSRLSREFRHEHGICLRSSWWKYVVPL